MVREGYKETEIGEIPVEWEVGPISDIAFVNPKTNTTLLTDRSEVTFLPMENVSESGKVMVNEVREFHEVKNGYTSFKEGDVLFAKITPCMQNGKGAHLTGLKNGVGFGSTEFHVLRPKSSGNSCFIYHLTLSKKFRLVSESYFSGSAGQQRVAKNVFYQYHVPLPPLPEQRRIAAILSTIDEAIEKTEALIAKLRQVKAGLMQDLLTKGIDEEGRVRSEETHAFKDSEIGRVPVEWEISNIGQVATFVGSGITPSGGSRVYKANGIPFLRSQNIHFGGLRLDNVACIDEKIHNSMQRTKLQPYDVLLNITGASIGRCTFVPQDFGEGNVNQHVCIIRLNDSGKPEFISSILSSHIGQFQIESLQAGLSREGLNYRQVRSIKIPLPLLPEQHRIAVVLTAADDRIAREETYRDKLLAVKKGLMADLLTGRVRVPEGVAK